MDEVLRKQVFLLYGRLLKRLKRLCWKRSRRVKACVGSNPMSSVVFQEAPKGVFLIAGRNQMDSFPSFLFEKNLEIFLKRSKLYIESFGGSA